MDDAKTNKARKSQSYSILTNQEMEALNRAAADGKHGRHYANNEYPLVRVHQAPGQPHRVQLSGADEAGMEALEKLTGEQDADSALAMLYIVQQLAPPGAQISGPAQGTIDFDDVIAKIGWTPRNSAHRIELQRRIWSILQFGERAVVIGTRSGAYTDKHTRKKRDTQIEASLWRIHKLERPTQGALFDEVPVRAEIIISGDWVEMLVSPQMAQFLPFGEVLGAIPGAKPSGAWARVIGLSLASFWRRLPRAALDGSIKPTRRELLERYPPKTGTVFEVLTGPNPRYAVEYWCGALKILVENGIVESSGEAAISYEEARQNLPRQDWAESWLDAQIEIRPGELMAPAIAGRAVALPAPKPKRR